MNRILTLCLLTLLFHNSLAQHAPQSAQKYLVKTDGTKITLHATKTVDDGIVSSSEPKAFFLTNDEITYVDAEGKENKLDQSDVTMLGFNGDRYLRLPIDDKKYRLLKVIATNGEYVMSIYRFLGTREDGPPAFEEYVLFIHDKTSHESLAPAIRYRNANTIYDMVMPTVKKYFGTCTSMIEKLEANSLKQRDQKKDKRKGPFDGVSDCKCGR